MKAYSIQAQVYFTKFVGQTVLNTINYSFQSDDDLLCSAWKQHQLYASIDHFQAQREKDQAKAVAYFRNFMLAALDEIKVS